MTNITPLGTMKPRLIQRCTIDKEENTLRYECMGSSQFHCGDQSESLKIMFKKGIALGVQDINIFDNNISVFVIAPAGFDFVSYPEVIKRLIKEEWHTQEATYLNWVIKKSLGIKIEWDFDVNTNAWFDFVNGALFTFTKENTTYLVDILENIKKKWAEPDPPEI